MPYNRIFISHSKDDPHKSFFSDIISALPTQAVWAELENIQNPASLWIKQQINNCDALFLLLSDKLTYLRHTANWVSFELGLGANRPLCGPLGIGYLGSGLDIYVFEPHIYVNTPLNFPVPHCNFYMLYDPQSEEHKKWLLQNFRILPENKNMIGIHIVCYHCELEFQLLTDNPYIYCPSCRNKIETEKSKLKTSVH